MARTRVKFCGFTRAEDAAAACELGVDAIGLNFVGGPRKLSIEAAEEILRVVPVIDVSEPMPCFKQTPIPVALCFAPSKESYGALWPTELGKLSINRLQVYGRDTIKLLDELKRSDPLLQVWPVVHLSAREDLSQFLKDVGDTSKLYDAPAIVVDTASKEKLGGTGQTFDWNWLAEFHDNEEIPPIILAGGLTPENVGEAIRIARPYAVDVASGVEVPGKPGVKDPVKMRDFLQAVRAADSQ